MREILFRGKRIDNSEWVISDCFFQCDGEVKLWDNPNRDGWVDVDLKTIGQYTGLTDKNGTKIFDGDIVKANHNIEQYNVYWKDYRFYIEDFWGNLIKPTQEAINHFECEVIGNIYDNPELLGGQNG